MDVFTQVALERIQNLEIDLIGSVAHIRVVTEQNKQLNEQLKAKDESLDALQQTVSLRLQERDELQAELEALKAKDEPSAEETPTP